MFDVRARFGPQIEQGWRIEHEEVETNIERLLKKKSPAMKGDMVI